MVDVEALSDVDIGHPIAAWEVDEYPQHERSKNWFVISAVLGVILVVYAVATANFLFAVIILMIGVITLLSTFISPERMPVVITSTGLVLGDMYYDFDAIRDFSIAYEPPHVKLLYLEFHSPWQPLLSIPLENTDPNEVREYLLPYCEENFDRSEETLTDAIRRMYKL